MLVELKSCFVMLGGWGGHYSLLIAFANLLLNQLNGFFLTRAGTPRAVGSELPDFDFGIPGGTV